MSKLNHSVTNKKQEDQIHFSPEKKTPDKGKQINRLPTHHTGWWISLAIKLSTHQFYKTFFHLYQNVYHAMEKKH